MKRIVLGTLALIISLLPLAGHAERHVIDGQRSTITIRVYKSGLFSVFAHDHQITTPVARGEIVDSENPSVEFWVDASALRVVDPDLSANDRAEVQKTMEGSQVLDVTRYPEIHFLSTAVHQTGADRWAVQGNLELHGQSHPIAIEVRQNHGSYTGSAIVKQREFGMRPIRIAGGTVSVKDSVKVEFEIVTAP